MNRKLGIFLLITALILTAFLAGCSKGGSIQEEVAEEQPTEEIIEPVQDKPQEIEELPADTETPSIDTVEEEPSVEAQAPEEPDKPDEQSSAPDTTVTSQETQVDTAESAADQLPAESEKPSGPSIQLIKADGTSIYISLIELKGKSDLQFSGRFYWLNSFGSTGHTEFKGVKLWSLLENMGIADTSSSSVKVIATDGYSIDFNASQIKRMDYIDETNQDIKLPVIIAWEENGEQYDPSEGAPFKLVIGQKEPGDVNKPQWVSNIEKIIVE